AFSIVSFKKGNSHIISYRATKINAKIRNITIFFKYILIQSNNLFIKKAPELKIIKIAIVNVITIIDKNISNELDEGDNK
ncbi:MAG: hypothetical protein PHF46_00505, partial [Candidatus Gracilibacteria bacterium]|nr:hypothetical protein [Candidatus Gracilibacteria bacterium]